MVLVKRVVASLVVLALIVASGQLAASTLPADPKLFDLSTQALSLSLVSDPFPEKPRISAAIRRKVGAAKFPHVSNPIGMIVLIVLGTALLFETISFSEQFLMQRASPFHDITLEIFQHRWQDLTRYAYVEVTFDEPEKDHEVAVSIVALKEGWPETVFAIRAVTDQPLILPIAALENKRANLQFVFWDLQSNKPIIPKNVTAIKPPARTFSDPRTVPLEERQRAHGPSAHRVLASAT